MKKFSKVLSVLFASIFVVCAASCEHKHNVGGEEWVRDSASHWHACDGCDELFDLSVHSYGDYVKDSKECKQTRTCTVCGFVQTSSVAHTWGAWANRADGSFGKECSHCHTVEYLTQYYIRGSFDANWSALEDYKLDIDATTMSASLTVNLTAGTKFKVATSDWGKEFNASTITAAEGLFGGSGDIEVLTTGKYTFKVTGLDTANPTCTVEIQGINLSKYTLTSIADAITIAQTAGSEPTTDRYFIYGTIKELSDASYGSMTITDGTNEIYVYGTYGADGVDRYSALSAKPVKGDEIVISANLCTYNGMPEVHAGWIQEFYAKPKEEVKLPEAGTEITIAQAIEIATAAGETATTDRWIIKGKVKTVVNSEYGEMYITDGTDEIYVYGTYDANGTNRYSTLADKPVAGDSIVLSVNLSLYKGTPQVKAGWIQSFTHEKPEINLEDYEVATITQAREAADGDLLKVTGVVAAITYADKGVRNGVYLIDGNASIYVYGRDVASQVEVGNTITVAAEKDYYILDTEKPSAEKYGYEGANQLTNSYLLENDKKVTELDFSFVDEKTVKEIMETPVDEENITTVIYKVTAYVNKVPGSGFVNYYINDLDNKTGTYSYTQWAGKDFVWLDEFDGKICTVYLTAHNAKSSNSGCVYRFVPIAVEDNGFEFDADYASEFVYTYNIEKQFLSMYNSDPAIELITNVKYEEFDIDANVTYTVLTVNAKIEEGILHITENGIAKVKVVVTAGDNTFEKIVEIAFVPPVEYTAITVAEAVAAEVGTEVILEGIVAGSLVNQSGFYLIDETGVMAVKGSETVISLLSVGDKVAVKGRRDLWGLNEGKTNPGQICVVDIEVICNFYGNNAYDKSNFITGKTVEDIYALDANEQHSNEVYVVKAIPEYLETAYYTTFKIKSLDGETTLSAYSSSANQYKWLKPYSGQEVEMTLVTCNWNKKTYYAVCVLSITVNGVTYHNTLNFAE